jgi:cell fate (sporulation/competence/biofilm development) regulator YmcA (YheA/YmcA/DUF963 family)
MDLLVKLSGRKAESLSYVFNNHKIRKIISHQRKKETILAAVDKLKEKLKNWRTFAREALNPHEKEKQEAAHKSDNYTRFKN